MTLALAPNSNNFGRGLRSLWQLEEGTTFLNHGAFGATPREVSSAQQQWRVQMEQHPSRFFMEELQPLILHATETLSGFIGAHASQTVMIENASSGICTVLNSLRLSPKAKIVTTNHVYNAVRNALRHVVHPVDGVLVEVPVPLPAAGPQDFLAALKGEVDEATSLVVIDHITSPSALILPVRDIVDHCHGLGVPVLVDGSHAPGGIDLHIDALGADWYVGNCHKWMCAPKGAAFLTVKSGVEQGLHPQVISHAYGAGFKAEFGKIGSRDATAWLSVPAAVALHKSLGGADLRKRNHQIALEAGKALSDTLKTPLAGPDEMFGPMISVKLPDRMAASPERAAEITKTLARDHRIDVLIVPHSDALWMRVSMHAYNDMADIEDLISALAAIPGLTVDQVSAGASTC